MVKIFTSSPMMPTKNLFMMAYKFQMFLRCTILSCLLTSHSKDLALAGERIGYVAISPNIKDVDLLVSAMTISIRVLGFVNAPALFQKVAGKFQRASVSITDYEKKRIHSMRFSWKQVLSV